MVFLQSRELYEKSCQLIPGGVNSPVRAFNSVGGKPIFIERADGAYLYDVDGNEYIDFINSWGPMILGHQFEPVVEAVVDQVRKGFSYGAPTENEYLLAKEVNNMAPWAELTRLTSTGTEACMSALRVARGFTGKQKFIKFSGNYHGHADPFLVKAGSGVLSLGIPGSPGVPEGTTGDTLVAEYNDLDNVAALFEKYQGEIAAIILEPVAGNMGCIPPAEGFLEGLRSLCDDHSSVLIFDEVMTGFRLAKGGASEVYNVEPDLVTYGKVIGGGLPVAAFAGKKKVMETIAPLGPVYQAGTLSGNPIAVACGLATLKYLNEHPEIYLMIENTTRRIKTILEERFLDHEVAINSVGSMVSIHFGVSSVTRFSDVANAENEIFNRMFHHLLANGIYLPPSPFESWFISQAINEDELGRLEEAIGKFEF